MKFFTTHTIHFVILTALAVLLGFPAKAQEQQAPEVLTGAALTRMVPPGFYFAGQSAPTQMRNSAAARVGKERFVVAGMVDTSGYSTEISGKYEGFFITDSPVRIGDGQLETGAYGFGFTNDGKLKFFDLSAKEILSVATTNDKEMRRPRPLTMTVDGANVRFYKGRNYALITAR